MLRSQDERELDRTFTKIETWEELTTRWNAIDTEQEAIGLLYAGTTIGQFASSSDPTDFAAKSKMIGPRIDFYLRQAERSNRALASVAEQVVVKHWLKRMQPWYAFQDDYLNAHRKLLNFLGEPRESLRKAPYPRFVSEYLLALYEYWSHGSSPDYRAGKAYHRLQALTDVLVKAMCTWGLAYAFGTSGDRHAAEINGLRSFLGERKYDAGAVFMKLTSHGNPPADLRDDQVNEAAAKALLRLKYWVGGGVTAKSGTKIDL